MRGQFTTAVAGFLLVLAGGLTAWAQATAVTGKVEVVGSKGSVSKDGSSVVLWLTPFGETAPAPSPGTPERHAKLVQTGKRFEPHLLVVPVGTAVEFPNRDPFFHNVFSLFEGKRFDLGLYEAGSSRVVHFDKPGISYIFCNIHPQMSAVVIALTTPYYAVSGRSGSFAIPNVPPGHYRIEVWYEASPPAALSKMRREVSISATSSSLGTLRVTDEGMTQLSHKNKYGRDYDDPTPTAPGYIP